MPSNAVHSSTPCCVCGRCACAVARAGTHHPGRAPAKPASVFRPRSRKWSKLQWHAQLNVFPQARKSHLHIWLYSSRHSTSSKTQETDSDACLRRHKCSACQTEHLCHAIHCLSDVISTLIVTLPCKLHGEHTRRRAEKNVLHSVRHIAPSCRAQKAAC